MRLIACVFLVASAHAATAVADSIHLETTRRIVGFASIVDEAGLNAADHFAVESNTAGVFDAARELTAETDLASMSIRAAQRTAVDPGGHLSGSGSVGVASSSRISEVSASTAESTVEARFALTAPALFHFAATMDASDEAVAQAFLEGGPAGTPDLNPSPGPLNHPWHVQRTGVLQPGAYHLVVTAYNDQIAYGASSFFDFDFSLTPTPEPASLVLVMLGGVGVAAQRRKAVPADEAC